MYLTVEALEVLSQACKVDPKNPQLHYQRAHVLIALGRREDAVLALEVVLTLAPREPPVYSLLGQVQQGLGTELHDSSLIQEALRNFNIAISLDPKEGTALKVHISLYLPLPYHFPYQFTVTIFHHDHITSLVPPLKFFLSYVDFLSLANLSLSLVCRHYCYPLTISLTPYLLLCL